MMTKVVSKALTSWEPISSRIITASFETEHLRIQANFIQCYAPPNDAEKVTKTTFTTPLMPT